MTRSTDDLVAAGRLGRVEIFVGAAHQLAGSGRPVERTFRDTSAHGEVENLIVEAEGMGFNK